MKIYLQDCKTLKFIRCDSSWSSDITEAVDFISAHRARLYGLRELKDVFQLLEVEADGVQFRVSASVGQLPAMTMSTPPRPVRSKRTSHVVREILARTGIWQSRRWAGQMLPTTFPKPGQILRADAIYHNVF